jgi:hypothetical protein
VNGRHLIGLRAAIEAGAIGPIEWRGWADRSMLEEPEVPDWLFKLSTAEEPVEAVAVLSEGSAQTDVSPEDSDLTSAHLGFLRLRYEAGDISLSELLGRAARVTDAANYDDPSCEALYLLLNEIDRGGPIQPSRLPLAERAAGLLYRHAQRANLLLGELAVQLRVAADRAAPGR